MMKKVMPKYSVIDLFAGAGGLSYGFLQSGRFEVKAAFEMCKNAQNTYRSNHGDNVKIYDDVEDALTEDISSKFGPIDVVVGGPPCQGFSNANRQKNCAINQNNFLIKKYIQVILHLKPIAFVMENVSMLQSETHRFYIENDDEDVIRKYEIKTKPADIILLDEKYLFNGVIDIVKDKEQISKFIWQEPEYITLNIIYKARKNSKKLVKALQKHKKRLLELARKLTNNNDMGNHIAQLNDITGEAIKAYYNNAQTSESAKKLCENIESAIALQRMLSKAKEIHDNNIYVSSYSQEHGLIAHVSSMAVIDYIEAILGADDNGYLIRKGVLSATEFGVPQKRMRFIIIGIKKTITNHIDLPVGNYVKSRFHTVRDAIEDIESIEISTDIDKGYSGKPLDNNTSGLSELCKLLRDTDALYNHVSTKTTDTALKRFKAIKQGENFHSLPQNLKTTYSNTERTQNTIYLRLNYDEPSGTVLNVRKSMWIHPTLHRAISIREAARLQTFPDSFIFYGTKDSQYQQIGNAVPPMLARALATHLCSFLDNS